jgi:hypothetical protein
MGIPLKEQLENSHPQADMDCEGCYGSGWLTALVDASHILEDAGLSKPADFLMKCDECGVYECDEDAQQSAASAGMNVNEHGQVFYTEAQLEFLKQPKMFALEADEGNPCGESALCGICICDSANRAYAREMASQSDDTDPDKQFKDFSDNEMLECCICNEQVNESQKEITVVRIGLSPDGTAHYFPYRTGSEDYDAEPMPAKEALGLITQLGIAVEIACNDPNDSRPHNYEGRIEKLEYI